MAHYDFRFSQLNTKFAKLRVELTLVKRMIGVAIALNIAILAGLCIYYYCACHPGRSEAKSRDPGTHINDKYGVPGSRIDLSAVRDDSWRFTTTLEP